MKRIIQFHISKGERYYVAEGVDLPVVTQGETLDVLVANIKEATELQLSGEDLADFDLGKDPSLLANIELSFSSHA